MKCSLSEAELFLQSFNFNFHFSGSTFYDVSVLGPKGRVIHVVLLKYPREKLKEKFVRKMISDLYVKQ